MIYLKKIEDLKKYTVFLYGAGNIGKQIYNVLNQNSIKITAVFDKFASTNDIFEVKNPFKNHDFETNNSIVIVTIFNRDVNFISIKEELTTLGFMDIVSIVDIYPIFSGFLSTCFWLSHDLSYLKKANVVYQLLEDDKSKKVFNQIVEARKTNTYDSLPFPENIKDQYFSTDVPWSPIMDFIDLGAYDGDTIDSLIDQNIPFERIFAFEPDINNFKKLSKKVKELGINAILYPCGTYSSSVQLGFSNEGTEGSKIDQSTNGYSIIQCVALDDIFSNCLNQNIYLKMDIEGAELETLKGCLELIKKYKPKLAVCLYHKPEDIITIPLFLSELHQYKFYIRQYGYYGLELVLYAIPE